MTVLVEDDPVLEVAVADAGMRRVLAHGAGHVAGGDGGADGIAVGLGDAGHRDGGRGGGERAGQDRRVAGGVQGDDQGLGAGRAGHAGLLDVLAAGVAAGHDRHPVAGGAPA